MEWTKRLLRRDGLRRFLCWLVSLYIRLVHTTGNWTVEGGSIPAAFHAAKRPFILAFWHGRLLMMPCAWPRRVPIHMLISGHRDGRIIADAVRHFGIDSIAGSTTSGGSLALRGMVRHLRAGECIGITPDGPDGPAMHASSGIVALARLAGASVVPLAYATHRRQILGTWDRFLLPFPFSRGIFIWGEPIVVPTELDDAGIERYRGLIERRLNVITAKADDRVGRECVSPGTLSRQASRQIHRQNGR